MVFYECVITAKNTALIPELNRLVKNFSLSIVKDGGVVRSIQNHGIRQLPVRFKARYPDAEGNRYYQKGRFISIYYDSNPHAKDMAENSLTLDAEVLRFTNLRARSPLDFINNSSEKRNPYIRRVLRMEAEEGERASKQQEGMSGETPSATSY